MIHSPIGLWTPTSSKHAFDAQLKLLSKYLDVKVGPAVTQARQETASAVLEHVPISHSTFINTLKINHEIPYYTKNVVITHGYGAGLAFFFKNYADIVKRLEHSRVFALDLVGMANSSRVELPPRMYDMDEKDDAKIVENYFVESMEDWRKQMGLESMHLIGHSMGGFLSACYALKYPERVKKLILLSPVGVPYAPKKVEQTWSLRTMASKLSDLLWENDVTPVMIIISYESLSRYL